MNLWFRLFRLLVTYRWPGGPEPCSVLGPCRTRFRVGPTDLDLFGHVNNGKYFSLLDLGRIDLLARSGLLAELRKRGWFPVVTAETMQFYRPLRWLQPFVIETIILGWDERSFIVRQTVLRPTEEGNEQIVADAIVRGLILTPSGRRTDPTEVLGLVGYADDAPPLPTWVAEWVAAQDATKPHRRTRLSRDA